MGLAWKTTRRANRADHGTIECVAVDARGRRYRATNRLHGGLWWVSIEGPRGALLDGYTFDARQGPEARAWAERWEARANPTQIATKLPTPRRPRRQGASGRRRPGGCR